MNKILLALAVLLAPLFAVSLVADDKAETPATPEAKAEAPTKPETKGDYPLEKCPVSGAKLGQMGEPVEHDLDGRTVKFCCGGCIPEDEKGNAEVSAKLDKMIADEQRASYPDSCVVSDELLQGEKVHEQVYGHKLVRLCCKACVGAFEKDSEKYLNKLADLKKQPEVKKEAEDKVEAPAE